MGLTIIGKNIRVTDAMEKVLTTKLSKVGQIF